MWWAWYLKHHAKYPGTTRNIECRMSEPVNHPPLGWPSSFHYLNGVRKQDTVLSQPHYRDSFPRTSRVTSHRCIMCLQKAVEDGLRNLSDHFREVVLALGIFYRTFAANVLSLRIINHRTYSSKSKLFILDLVHTTQLRC